MLSNFPTPHLQDPRPGGSTLVDLSRAEPTSRRSARASAVPVCNEGADRDTNDARHSHFCVGAAGCRGANGWKRGESPFHLCGPPYSLTGSQRRRPASFRISAAARARRQPLSGLLKNTRVGCQGPGPMGPRALTCSPHLRLGIRGHPGRLRNCARGPHRPRPQQRPLIQQPARACRDGSTSGRLCAPSGRGESARLSRD
jgi:hypothetical protein